MFHKSTPLNLRRLFVAGTSVLSLLAPSVVLAQGAPSATTDAVVGTYAAAGTGPALWVVRDEDSTLYLFGTFHALKADTAWRTPAVDQAFASADEYWFEIASLKDVDGVVPIIQQKGLSMTRPLSSLLTADEMASLDKAAKTVGLTAAQLDPMRPWFASLNLAVATITAGGYKPEHGGDHVLHSLAEATGRPIKGFETMSQQVGFLADMDEESQLQALRASLADFERGAEQLDHMVNLWATGNTEGLDTLLVETTRTEAPVMYEKIFTQRNQKWADQVEQMLAGSGTVFIAVGAGHLVGSDSLQAQLEKRGIRSQRVALSGS